MALGTVFYLPGVASADYVQRWVENGLYDSPLALQTWDKVEAFLISPGNWTGTGLSNFSVPGWTATVINPGYVMATGPSYNSTILGNFYFSTSSTDLTQPYTWDWFVWNGSQIVGVQRSTWSAQGWTFSELTADPPSENRFPVPIPGSLLLLGSGMAALGFGRLRKKRPTSLDSARNQGPCLPLAGAFLMPAVFLKVIFCRLR
jgi:hypothetical protein